MDYFIPTPEPQADPKRESLHLGKLALAVALIPVLALVGELTVSVLLALVFPEGAILPSWLSLTLGSLCMYGFAMPLSWLVFRTCEKSPLEPTKLPPIALPALLSVCLTLTIVGSIVGNIVNLILSALTGVPVSNPVAEMTANTPMWTIVLFTVIVAPVLEELFFRKIVIDRLRRYGDLPAVLVSGLLFGLIHGNFSQFFYASLLGIVFGFVYCRTGCLRYTIFLHMFINFFGSVYAMEMLKAFGDMPEVIDLAYLIGHKTGLLMLAGYLMLYGLAFVCSIPSAIKLIGSIRLQKVHTGLTASQWRSVIFRNPLIWLLVAVLAARFALSLIPV